MCLLVSMLPAIELIGLTKADPYIPPEEAPAGYRIRSDGTYDAPNLRRDGNVYTFIGDIQGTIVIERDGVVLDGAGYTLQGNGSSYGVWLQDRKSVTIKNLTSETLGMESGLAITSLVGLQQIQTALRTALSKHAT
jgi:hypothetical protein